MPVLHKYKGRDEYYILTRIKGNIITFQLTEEGQQTLKKAGIKNREQFRRALLLDLYRSGNVYTSGSGPGEIIDDLQLELDLKNDPEPEKMFPACVGCSSIQDLHLVEVSGNKPFVSILCRQCRATKEAIDTSIPLSLVTRGNLSRLLEIKQIKKIDASVSAYKKLLDAEFESKWAAYTKGKPVQALLLDPGDGKQEILF